MLDLVEQNLPAIRALCVESGVCRLELFGSAARGDFNPQSSDLDFFVEFQDLGWQGSFKRYMRLKLGLEDLLATPSTSWNHPLSRILISFVSPAGTGGLSLRPEAAKLLEDMRRAASRR